MTGLSHRPTSLLRELPSPSRGGVWPFRLWLPESAGDQIGSTNSGLLLDRVEFGPDAIDADEKLTIYRSRIMASHWMRLCLRAAHRSKEPHRPCDRSPGTTPDRVQSYQRDKSSRYPLDRLCRCGS